MQRSCRLLAAVCLLSAPALATPPIYVKADATGDGSGNSWANAKTTITAAVGAAGENQEIWVAAGTYTGPVDLTGKAAVKVYGGFAGTETTASQSNPDTNVTTISGGGTERAVVSHGNDAGLVLRGFRLTGGSVQTSEYGGAMKLADSQAKIVRCTFTGNNAGYFAGAVATWGGSPTFVNCKFYGNSAGMGCGAVMCREFGTPTFVNCLFYENQALEAGAVCNLSGATQFLNCTFTANQATEGKGGALVDNKGEATLRNCILWNNQSATPSTNSIYSNTAATTIVTYSNVQGGWTGSGNIDADPNFLDAANDDYRLGGPITPASPCKDTGNNGDIPSDSADLDWDTIVTEQLPFDLTGTVNRLRNAAVDMGAYEWIKTYQGD